MVGMEEMTFPSRRAIDDIDPASMEEERRLCYVGMTRAMRRLFLSAARYRRIYGKEEIRQPSRFLGELPDEVVGNFPSLARARRGLRPTGIRWMRARRAGRTTGAGTESSTMPPLRHRMAPTRVKAEERRKSRLGRPSAGRAMSQSRTSTPRIRRSAQSIRAWRSAQCRGNRREGPLDHRVSRPGNEEGHRPFREACGHFVITWVRR